MIGIFKTTDPNTGQGIVIRYTRVNNNVRITDICDTSGANVLKRFGFEEIQKFKSDIYQLAQ